MFPGPGKGKSKSNMPKKAKDQCAETGKCKVDGASKISMKTAAKDRQKKKIKDDIEDEKKKGKVVPKFKTSAKYKVGGRVNKMEPESRSFSSNENKGRSAQGTASFKR